MTRRNRSRLQLVTCAALLSALATVGVKAPAAAPDDAPASLETWSSAVWQSALDGRRRDVERFLTDAPKESMPETIGSRFRETMDLRQTNREKARNVRQQAMEDALAKLEEHLAEDDLINALESAVEVQTLSDDMAAASKPIKTNPMRPLGRYSSRNSGIILSGSSAESCPPNSGLVRARVPITRPVEQYASVMGKRSSPLAISTRRASD